ncbi:HNH endonuclease [Saccharothrix coeruleofusca]|uniref:HNH endonuclease n=1 Tax=Saccharothrix coeruleofusca TaxID=33919 RepID=A0A918EDN2_9PSEU|nr:HNH endonuclease [Saccharothrix coeruleofusca]GGP45777.1 hypothetical protein GCM10010185_16730 [Saccharothrix coeruleofusca]
MLKTALSEIGRQEVLRAIAEHDKLGAEEFLKRYGYGEARALLLVHEGRHYPSKAIVGVAHGFLPGRTTLRPKDFTGGIASVVRVLEGLGFTVRDLRETGEPDPPAEDLLSGLLALDSATLHEPLALLWAISRVENSDRLHTLGRFRSEVGDVLAEFGGDNAPHPERAFHELSRTGAWEVVQSGDAEPRAGFTAWSHERLRADVAFRTRAINAIRARFLHSIDDHEALLAFVGLADYARVDALGTSTPGKRPRSGTATARVRDVARHVKALHDNQCQFCGTRLRTGFGFHSEAAHIVGLAAVHGGEDVPENVLCLCRNCHVQFDTFALYVDEHDVVRWVHDGSEAGRLRRHPEHYVDPAHLAYQRSLCAIDPGPGGPVPPPARGGVHTGWPDAGRRVRDR